MILTPSLHFLYNYEITIQQQSNNNQNNTIRKNTQQTHGEGNVNFSKKCHWYIHN